MSLGNGGRLASAVLGLFLAIALTGGCVIHSVDGGKVAATQPTSDLVQVDTLYTTATARDAASTLADTLLNQFLLEVRDKNGQWRSEHIDSADLPGDAFSAAVTARTHRGQFACIDCQWQGEGKTLATISSNLPPAQHQAVIKQLKEWLAQRDQWAAEKKEQMNAPSLSK